MSQYAPYQVFSIPQALAHDATGADTYATLLTTDTERHQLYIVNTGTHDAIISLDGGVTDHAYVMGESALTLDFLRIPANTEIQAKNGVAGSNYTNLYVTAW